MFQFLLFWKIASYEWSAPLSLEWEWRGNGLDDESGESISMELISEVPIKEPAEAEMERFVRGWQREGGSWFQRRAETYWKERSVVRRKDVDVRAWPYEKRVLREAELWWGYADMKVAWLWCMFTNCHLLMHNNLTGYITLTIDTGN